MPLPEIPRRVPRVSVARTPLGSDAERLARCVKEAQWRESSNPEHLPLVKCQNFVIAEDEDGVVMRYGCSNQASTFLDVLRQFSPLPPDSGVRPAPPPVGGDLAYKDEWVAFAGTRTGPNPKPWDELVASCRVCASPQANLNSSNFWWPTGVDGSVCMPSALWEGERMAGKPVHRCCNVQLSMVGSKCVYTGCNNYAFKDTAKMADNAKNATSGFSTSGDVELPSTVCNTCGSEQPQLAADWRRQRLDTNAYKTADAQTVEGKQKQLQSEVVVEVDNWLIDLGLQATPSKVCVKTALSCGRHPKMFEGGCLDCWKLYRCTCNTGSTPIAKVLEPKMCHWSQSDQFGEGSLAHLFRGRSDTQAAAAVVATVQAFEKSVRDDVPFEGRGDRDELLLLSEKVGTERSRFAWSFEDCTCEASNVNFRRNLQKQQAVSAALHREHETVRRRWQTLLLWFDLLWGQGTYLGPTDRPAYKRFVCAVLKNPKRFCELEESSRDSKEIGGNPFIWSLVLTLAVQHEKMQDSIHATDSDNFLKKQWRFSSQEAKDKWTVVEMCKYARANKHLYSDRSAEAHAQRLKGKSEAERRVARGSGDRLNDQHRLQCLVPKFLEPEGYSGRQSSKQTQMRQSKRALHCTVFTVHTLLADTEKLSERATFRKGGLPAAIRKMTVKTKADKAGSGGAVEIDEYEFQDVRTYVADEEQQKQLERQEEAAPMPELDRLQLLDEQVMKKARAASEMATNHVSDCMWRDTKKVVDTDQLKAEVEMKKLVKVQRGVKRKAVKDDAEILESQKKQRSGVMKVSKKLREMIARAKEKRAKERYLLNKGYDPLRKVAGGGREGGWLDADGKIPKKPKKKKKLKRKRVAKPVLASAIAKGS